MPRREVLIYDGLEPCPYLPGRHARLPLWFQQADLSPEQADEAFAAGERRAGRALYHAACPACAECRTLRVLAAEFVPSRSQRRAWRRWRAEGRVEIGEPDVDAERVALYNAHKHGRNLASEAREPMTEEEYHAWFVGSCLDGIEMRYYLGDRLAGVGIVDVGATSLSSVYFYFDPDPVIARYSPGVVSVLQEIELCVRTDRPHLYLGLYVRDCASLSYKGDYRPQERFVDGAWVRFEAG